MEEQKLFDQIDELMIALSRDIYKCSQATHDAIFHLNESLRLVYNTERDLGCQMQACQALATIFTTMINSREDFEELLKIWCSKYHAKFGDIAKEAAERE